MFLSIEIDNDVGWELAPNNLARRSHPGCEVPLRNRFPDEKVTKQALGNQDYRFR
jgi:hypothetical protein